jgi:hypothetical protein
MSVKSHLEQAVKALEAEREREVEAIKQRVTREILVPYNKEMDEARDKAIAELQANLNSAIVAHQAQFTKDKQAIIDANEKKKDANATTVITSESYTVTVKYDKVISKLKEQIKDLKE